MRCHYCIAFLIRFSNSGNFNSPELSPKYELYVMSNCFAVCLRSIKNEFYIRSVKLSICIIPKRLPRMTYLLLPERRNLHKNSNMMSQLDVPIKNFKVCKDFSFVTST